MSKSMSRDREKSSYSRTQKSKSDSQHEYSCLLKIIIIINDELYSVFHRTFFAADVDRK